MLPLKPHLVTVATASEGVDNYVATSNVFAEPVEVYGQITAKDISAAFDTFGFELKQPHKFMFELDDAPLFAIGSRVYWDNRTFAVTSPVRYSKHGLATDHAAVMLEELDV